MGPAIIEPIRIRQMAHAHAVHHHQDDAIDHQ
jgi:hypothetical protein